MIKYFEFEKDVEKIDQKINNISLNDRSNLTKIENLKNEKNQILKKIYSNLNPWQKVQVSRHNDI